MVKKISCIILVMALCLTPISSFGSVASNKTLSKAEVTKSKSNSVKVARPKGVKAKGTDYNKIRISWKKVKNADGYRVYRYFSKKNKYICIKVIKSGKKTSCVNSGLEHRKRYAYRVCAYVKQGKKIIKSKKSARARGCTLKSYKGITFKKPVKKLNLISPYGNRGGGFHIGADYGGRKGAPVYAVASGVVTKSKSNYGGLGEGIVIKHSKGIVTWYGHLNSRNVYAGRKVKAGQKIGTVGSTGNAGCNHLHLEVWIKGKTWNPHKFF